MDSWVFNTELELEKRIRELIQNQITVRHPNVVVLDNKTTFDLVVCRNGVQPDVFFIETKLFQEHHGRMGIGSRKGLGIQPEILNKQPDFFESHLRWLLVDGRSEKVGFHFFETATVKTYISGNTIGKKYNNINLSIFEKESPLAEEQLLSSLEEWLTS